MTITQIKKGYKLFVFGFTTTVRTKTLQKLRAEREEESSRAHPQLFNLYKTGNGDGQPIDVIVKSRKRWNLA